MAAVLKKPLKEPDVSYTEHKTKKKPIAVEVQAPDLCPRYIGHYVENVKGGETPAWMRRRLALSGLRSISPVVDITNFVLLEMGQPMHAFDADEIGGGKIVVRRAKQGEKITTLDEKQFALCPDNLVICDGEKPVALAGIMGGLNSEITDGTKNVFFEAAKFARDSVRRTSRSLGQSSDSSFRFEKGVSAYTSEKGMARALHLIEELGCGTVTNLSEDVCAADLTPRKMTASIQKIEALLGIFVPREEIEGILSRLSFAPVLDGDNLTVTVPAWREDVDGYPDLAEEIIRMYGYDHIVPTFLERASVTGGGLSDAQRLEGKVKEVLRTQGFDEACTYSFYSPKEFDLFRLREDAPERRAVHILNPISEDLSVLRTFLAPSMLQNAVRNIRRGNEEGRQFEIANAYLPRSLPVSGQPEEKKRLALAVWGNKCDFFDLKGAAEALEEEFHFCLSCKRAEIPWLHPGVSARLMLGEKEVGCIGELDPAIALSLGLDKKVYLGELDLEALYPGMSAEAKFVNLPRFPAVKRDLALVADEDVTCAQVEEELMRACKYVTKAELFDVYRGGQVPEGKKSMAFTLTFTPDEHAEKAFTPEALDGFVRKILGNLKFKLNVELR